MGHPCPSRSSLAAPTPALTPLPAGRERPPILPACPTPPLPTPPEGTLALKEVHAMAKKKSAPAHAPAAVAASRSVSASSHAIIAGTTHHLASMRASFLDLPQEIWPAVRATPFSGSTSNQKWTLSSGRVVNTHFRICRRKCPSLRQTSGTHSSASCGDFRWNLPRCSRGSIWVVFSAGNSAQAPGPQGGSLRLSRFHQPRQGFFLREEC